MADETLPIGQAGNKKRLQDQGDSTVAEVVAISTLKGAGAGFSYQGISTNTTTLVKTGAGVLHAIVVNTTAAGSIKICDALTNTTPVIGTLKSSIAEGTYIYDAAFTVGLTIVTAAASDITVIYR